MRYVVQSNSEARSLLEGISNALVSFGLDNSDPQVLAKAGPAAASLDQLIEIAASLDRLIEIAALVDTADAWRETAVAVLQLMQVSGLDQLFDLEAVARKALANSTYVVIGGQIARWVLGEVLKVYQDDAKPGHPYSDIARAHAEELAAEIGKVQSDNFAAMELAETQLQEINAANAISGYERIDTEALMARAVARQRALNAEPPSAARH
jgi:hypothetical protein